MSNIFEKSCKIFFRLLGLKDPESVLQSRLSKIFSIIVSSSFVI